MFLIIAPIIAHDKLFFFFHMRFHELVLTSSTSISRRWQRYWRRYLRFFFFFLQMPDNKRRIDGAINLHCFKLWNVHLHCKKFKDKQNHKFTI